MRTATPPAEVADDQPEGRWARIVAAADRPVAADSAAIFRIGFGLLVTYSSLRFLWRGWVDTLYLAPANHLSYPGFEWVQPLPGPWMHLHMAMLAVLGLCIAVGYRHRIAAGLFTVGFLYAELIDAALYLNHYWYVTIVGGLLTLLPVHHRWSLDAWTGRVRSSRTVPVGVVWVLRAQLAVVYLFAGVAKLNADWLLRAQPMRTWLADRTDLAVIGSVLDEPLVAYAASWAGALFDCTIVGWLLWRRSRPSAYVAVIGFHAVTGWLFQIGVFPLVMIAGTLVFFSPEWPQRWRRFNEPRPLPPARVDRPHLRGLLTGLLLAIGAIQVALPLRHYAHDSNVRWSEEGSYLSWRVMLTEKAGRLDFEVTDPATGRSWLVEPGMVLTDWQAEQASVRPDLLHATALMIAEEYTDRGLDVEVRADAWVSMNGRPAQRIVDPTVDLAAQPRTWGAVDWILPAP